MHVCHWMASKTLEHLLVRCAYFYIDSNPENLMISGKNYPAKRIDNNEFSTPSFSFLFTTYERLLKLLYEVCSLSYCFKLLKTKNINTNHSIFFIKYNSKHKLYIFIRDLFVNLIFNETLLRGNCSYPSNHPVLVCYCD